MEKPLISVVIPTYNRKDRLLTCIESVLAQTYEKIEVIVADDASTDGTEDLFTDFSDDRVHYLRYEENRGACYARNYGASYAKGELLAFQDSDDTWHADKLEKQYQYLIKSGASLCFCGMNRTAENGNQFYFPVHAFHKEYALEEFLAENRASTQTMLMYRYVWEHLRFDEAIRRYQDWDFGIRAAKEFACCYLPEALVESQVGTDSISARVESYRHLLHLYKKHSRLYEQYPKSAVIMNRRLGMRVHKTDPVTASAHFKQSYLLGRQLYDLAYWLTDAVRALFLQREKRIET